MTQLQRRRIQLNNHYESLAKLATICGVNNPNGKKLSVALLKLEHEAHKLSTDYCNGENGVTTDNWDEKIEPIENKVQSLFNNNLHGFFVNGDARGYALKIKDDVLKQKYAETNLYRDWGGYGILSPEITGK